MKSIFPFDIMENITYSSFARDDYGFFIILIIVLSFNSLRPYKEWECPIFICLITITTTCSNLGDLSNLNKLHSVRAKLLNEFFQFAHSLILQFQQ